ncbi:MAG TPA: Uma2 family endonuclease [Beijerinckiaceae bacterium]|jgi:Uma2 family endonuclease
MADFAQSMPEPMGLAEFLSFVDQQIATSRWELIDGVPQMMTGGTAAHSLLISNVLGLLDRAARARGCRAMTSFLAAVDDRNMYEPDVLVRCGPIQPAARSASDPVIVVEVLSRSTIRRDRVLKFERYRSLASVQQIIFVYQDSIRIESWMREHGDWRIEPTLHVQREDGLPVPTLGAFVPLADIYDGITPSPLNDD